MSAFLDLFMFPIRVALTLKKVICFVLSNYCLDVLDSRGQEYDDASNMRTKWNGLEALIMRDCPYAYFVIAYHIVCN